MEHDADQDAPRALLGRVAEASLALVLSLNLHELGHALASRYYGDAVVLYQLRIRSHAGSLLDEDQRAVMVASGMVVGGVVGLCGLVAWRWAAYRRLGAFWVYCAAMGVAGYLLTAPFVPEGDVAKLLAYLGAGPIASWACVVAGLVGCTAVVPFVRASVGVSRGRDAMGRRAYLWRAVLPMVLAALVVFALSFPQGLLTQGIALALYPIPLCAGLSRAGTVDSASPPTPPGVALAAAVVLVVFFCLRWGVAL